MTDAIDRRLDEIEARVNAATPGKWRMSVVEEPEAFPCFKNEHWDIHRQETEAVPERIEPGVWVGKLESRMVNVGCFLGDGADVAFIVNARDDVPWLLASLREARRELTEQAIDHKLREAEARHAIETLESRLSEARRELAIVRDEPMRGDWTCDKCGFVESRRRISVRTGAVGTVPVADNPCCPNDGTPLRVKTWREFAKDLMARHDELWVELAEAKLALDITPADRLADNRLSTRVEFVLAREASRLAASEARAASAEQDAARWRTLVAAVEGNSTRVGLGGGVMLWTMAANEHDPAEASIQALDHENPRKTVWYVTGSSLDGAADRLIEEWAAVSRDVPTDAPAKE